MNRWHLIFISILFFGGGWLWWTQAPTSAGDEERAPQPAVNHPAPDFDLVTLDGDRISLAALQGKPMVINFWATWCAPCRAEMPMLQSTWERYADTVVIIGVDVDEDPAVVKAFVDELGLTFPIALDQGAEMSGRYNVRGLPTTLFVDGSGVIRKIYPGQLHSAILAEGIGEIMR